MKKLLSKLKTSILLITAITVIGKGLIYLAELLIAIKFGASSTTDAFILARIVPLRIGSIISWALYIAFVPFYLKMFIKDREEAKALSFTFQKNVLIFSFILSLFISVYADFIIKILAPGFDIQTCQLSANLLRIMSWSILMVNVAAILQSINSSHKHELISSSAQPLNNLVILISIFISVKFLGIYAVAVGVLLGSIFKLLLQFVSYNPLKEFLTNRTFFTNRRLLHEIWQSFFMIVGILLVNELIMFIVRIFASHYEGAVSILNYGFVIAQVPLLIIETSIFYIFYPLFAEHSINPDIRKLRSSVINLLKSMFFILIPLTFLIFILSGLITRVLFLHGKFNWNTADKTATAVGFFSLSLFSLAVDALAFKIAVVLNKTKIYFPLAIFRLVINIILCFVLIRWLNPISALSLAYSLAVIFNSVLLMSFISTAIKYKNKIGSVFYLVKILFCSLVMGGAVFLIQQIFVKSHFMTGFIPRAMSLSILLSVGFAVYLMLCKIMNIKEYILTRKFWDSKFNYQISDV